MLFLPYKVDDDVTLNIPRDVCCNCGRSGDLSLITTPLTVVRYMVLAGTQLTIRMELPYCNRCSSSAKRKPLGTIKKLLVSAVAALLLTMVLIARPDLKLQAVIRDNLFFVCAAVALIAVFGLYSLQKPRADQSSYYQPVRLRKLKQKFSGRITGYRLAFTNELYAQKIIAANPEAIASGVLEVASVSRRKKPSGGGFAWALLFLSSGRMPPPPPQSQIEQETGERKNRETGRSNDT